MCYSLDPLLRSPLQEMWRKYPVLPYSSIIYLTIRYNWPKRDKFAVPQKSPVSFMGEEWSLDDVILIHRIAASWKEKWKDISDRFHRQTGHRKLASRWRTFPFYCCPGSFLLLLLIPRSWKAARRRICLWSPDAFLRFSFCYSFLSVRVLDHWNLFCEAWHDCLPKRGFLVVMPYSILL